MPVPARPATEVAAASVLGSVCVDYDHACCPDEKKSCGKCVRGLLCVSCNTALGIIERKYEMARAYLDTRARLVESGCS